MSAGWEEGSILMMLNWEVRPVSPSVTDGEAKQEEQGRP